MTLSQTLTALRSEGFKAESRAFCGADASLAYSISNEPADRAAYNRTQSQVGIIDCSLYKKPVFPAQVRGDLHEPAYSPLFHGRKAHFWFRNVECLIYAGDKLQDRQIARLATAMRELAAS